MTQINRAIPDSSLHDRLLQAIAECATALLSGADFDRGVNTALKILAESAGIDRIAVCEHCGDATGKTLGSVIGRYEWCSPQIIPQLTHPSLNYISYAGLEAVYHACCNGRSWGGSIESMLEPLRSGQKELGVQSTYAVPIMVAGQYWGFVGLDYCQAPQVLGEAELAALKTAAACIGSAIQRDRTQHDRERAERQALLEQQRSQELQERDRILTTTAAATQALLSGEDFDQAVNRAIQIIGEGLVIDRIGVMEHYDVLPGETLGGVKGLYEWCSPHTVSQLNHPELQQVSYAGIEDWHEQMRQGMTIGGVVAELAEPFRSGQEAIGVKSTYSVPIVVEGQYWGIFGLDHCREAKQLSESEITVLKMTAACLGSAIAQHRVRQAQAETERIALLEQARSQELAERNQLLEERDRILAATSEAANVLLTIENFDDAINAALEIIGERLDTDRVSVLEHFDDSSGQTLGHLKILYEWDFPDTSIRIAHSEYGEISYEGIEAWYELHRNGQGISCVLDDMQEPFRTIQASLGVKALHGVPIMLDNEYWGVIVFDDCRTAKRRDSGEMVALRTIADCIGSAIQRDRSRKDREAAVLARSQELEAHNQILESREQWLEATAAASNALLSIEDLDTGINEALRLIGETVDVDRADVMQYVEDSAVHPLGLMQMLYEWHSPYASSQLLHPTLINISADGIEDLVIQLQAGEWIGGTIDEFDEPFRSGQIELGVQSTYSVPIFIDGQFWGFLGIDHCREKKQLSLAEIAVFKTAANCIGSAIQQDQNRRERQTAERAVLDERNRLAREIHDTLAQAFTGISLQLEAAKDLQPTPTIQAHLQQARTLARDGLTEARRSVLALRSPLLETHDLPQALQQMLQTLTAGTTLRPELCIEGTIRPLPPTIEDHLLRISQESLTNTLRHAQASTFHLTLIFDTPEIHLQIRDNGQGFDPAQITPGFGLLGMQERVSQMHGQLRLESKLGEGTTIDLAIPQTSIP